MQASLRQRKMSSSPVEKRAGAGTDDRKEEDAVDEIEAATSSTRSETGMAAMSKLVNEMASLYSIYNVDFGILAEEHELVVREDLTWKADFVLTYSLYNVRKDGQCHHEEYDAFDSNNMMEMANVLKDRRKPRAYERIFCSAVQFVLWYRVPPSKNKEERASTGKDSGED